VTSTDNFRIETNAQGSASAIRVAGELDSASCDRLADVFEQTIAGGDVAEIVIDLSGLAFIDSAGLRAVIILERIAQARGLELVLVPPSEPLLDLLRITGLATRVRLASELDEAQAGEFAERIELDLPCDLTAPGIARAEVRAALQRTQSDGDSFTAVLLTSEIVTNAVRHSANDGPGPIAIRIICSDDRLQVEVVDPGPGFDPADVSPEPTDLGGRGLMVVDRSASRWGTRRMPSAGGERFCVWFELGTGPGKSSAITLDG
jgi:anti-anti-sigma factor